MNYYLSIMALLGIYISYIILATIGATFGLHRYWSHKQGKRRVWFEGGQMPLSRRLPKRGFTNNFKKEFQIVNLDKLGVIEEKNIDANTLFTNGLIRSPYKPVKILGSGELKHAIKVVATAFSMNARKKIENAGGEAKTL